MRYVIGVDEVGRGCLFGPVVASAVSFLPGKKIPQGLTDSKKLKAQERERISKEIYQEGHLIGVGFCTPQEIDEINILQASLLAMYRAIKELKLQNEEILEIRVDGNQTIPKIGNQIVQRAIIKGDLKDQAIAAASVVAKVYRDKLIEGLSNEYPGYQLAKHKGYPTKAHKEALARLGVSDQHRRSFKGVSEFL